MFHLNQDTPIAHGATAELFAWGDNVVLKLYRSGYSAQEAEHEAARARIVHAASLPTPATLGLQQVDGRAGVLFERVDGPTMLQQMLGALDESSALAHTLAEMHGSLHQIRVANVPMQSQRLMDALRRAVALRNTERAEMEQLLEHLIHDAPASSVL